jgi:hypothetical protein
VSNHTTIAVLITYFNERDLLTDCLNSLVRQTLPVAEILIYDDASHHPAHCYIPPGVHATIIRGAVNRGPSAGRNALLNASRSDYVHYHDADDWFDPMWSEQVSEKIRATHTDAVFTELAAYRNGSLVTQTLMGIDALVSSGDLLRFCLREVMQTPAGTYRRENVLAAGGYSCAVSQSEDYEFHIRLALSGLRFEVVNRPLVNIRLRHDSRSQDAIALHADAVSALALHASSIPQAYKTEVADALVRRGSQLFRLGAADLADVAFSTARACSAPTYSHAGFAYRAMARAFGPSVTERCAFAYRRCLPVSLRQILRTRRISDMSRDADAGFGDQALG